MTADSNVLTAEFVDNAEPPKQPGKETMRDIPDYRTASAKLRAAIDGLPGVRPIMETLTAGGIPDVNAALTFGDEAQTERGRVSEEILAAQEGDSFDFLRDPMEKAAGFMDNFDLDGIGAKLGSMARQGTAIAKRNPFLLAGAAATAFVSLPVALVAGGTAIALKEKAHAMRERGKPETAEQLEEKLRQGMADFKPMIRNLEAARERIPALRKNTQNLGAANIDSLAKTTLYISAGREIIRRIAEEIIPEQATQGMADDAETLRTFSRYMEQKLAVLDQARNGSILDVMKMANLIQAIDDNDINLQSILTQEIHQHRSTMAANGMAVDALRMSRLINHFRERTEKDATRAIQATQTARELAASSQINSPERLQATLDNMNQMRTMLEKSIKALPAANQAKESLQKQLTVAAGQVIDAQVKYARQAANSNLLDGNTAKALSAGSQPIIEAKRLPGPSQS
jgi:hypothetical protein